MGPPSILWGWVLMATMSTGATASLVEQRPRWVLVARGQAKTLHCILRNSQYPWMSWYQQDLQGSLQVLATLRSPGDEEVVSRPGADYRVKRVNSTELRLQVTNVTQGRSLYCTCSTHSERPPLGRVNTNHPGRQPQTQPPPSPRPPMLPCCLFSTSDSSCSFPMPFRECSACLAQRFNHQFNL